MSVVTDVLILCGLAEELVEDADPPAFSYLNAWLVAENYGPLRRLNGHEGGRKVWQAEVWGGAFNALDLPEFLQVVTTAPWEDPAAVQLVLKGEEDVIWGLVPLVDPHATSAHLGSAAAERALRVWRRSADSEEETKR